MQSPRSGRDKRPGRGPSALRSRWYDVPRFDAEMSTWDEEFRQLQAEFLRGGPDRLVDIDETLDRLDRGTAATLADLKRHFHKLAGAGATYQRPQISTLAREAERRCDELIKGHQQPSSDDVGRWRDIRQRLTALFDEGIATTVLAEPEPATPATGGRRRRELAQRARCPARRREPGDAAPARLGAPARGHPGP